MNPAAALAHTVVAAIHTDGPEDARRFVPTLRALRRADPQLRIVLGAPDPRQLDTDVTGAAEAVELRHSAGLARLVTELAVATHGHVLAVSDAVLVPPGFLDIAREMVAADLRIGTVSFLSNAAGYLSFPHRNMPIPRAPDGHDETSITRRLRAREPLPPPVPVPAAAGAAVLISAWALSALGRLDDVPSGRFELALLEFSLDARSRGFIDVLDATTFVTRPWDLAASRGHLELTAAEQAHLEARHPYYAGFLAEQEADQETPLALALASARAAVDGLSVVVEAGCLGPLEMGTQVQTLSLIEALARRDDIRRVGVALSTEIPPYARRVLSLPKVDARPVPPDDFSAFGEVDVVHRPYQPDRPLDIAGWRSGAARTVVTLQDLIAYHVGAYHGNAENWLGYRRALRDAARAADGVVVISEDTRSNVVRERLGVDASRVFIVENGIDHLRGDETARIPAELLARGFVAGDFLLVLGANYGHKNRDLAVRAWQLLRERGRDLALVLVGAAVPHGSSRLGETLAAQRDDGLFVIPDVASEERNWLLRHARVMLYPTSAEGFGLLPYEAARFGTPTVLVSFGPFREVAGELPISAASWDPEAFAEATDRLLADPALAERLVDRLRAAEARYSWDTTAAGLANVYRELLDRPAAAR